MRSLLTAIDTFIIWLSRAALAVASAFIGALAFLGTADVIGSAAFHTPVPSALELSEVALVIIVFMGMAQAQHKEVHITVDVLSGRFRGLLRRASRMLALIAAITFFGFIAWFGFEAAMQSFAIKEYAPGAMPIPVYPGKFLLAFGSFIAMLEALRGLCHALLGDDQSNDSQQIEAIQ